MMTTANQWTLGDSLISSATARPSHVAIVDDGTSYTYEQLLTAASSLAASLREQGVQRGDRVAVFMDNSWTAVVSIYAATLADAVFMVLHPQMKADKLSFVLQDSGAAALLTAGRLERVATEAAASTSGIRFIAALQPREVSETILDLDALMRERAALSLPRRAIQTDLAALVYTSGSTADPKGVMLTHGNMVFATESICTYLRLRSDDTILCVLPLSFDYGLYQVLMAVRLGATVRLERSMAFPAQIADLITNTRPTVFPGVPTSFANLLSVAESTGQTFDSVTRVTNTAAALQPTQIMRMKEIFPNALIFSMYGLTECKRVSYLEPDMLDGRLTSVGKAIPGTEVLLLNAAGVACQPGEAGILHVRGPHVMAGYWNRPDKTAEMLVEGLVPGERMLRTGDLFRQDADGFLYFVSRTDEIIKTRGEKVSPLEVEQVVHELEGVKEAAVVGVPDDVLGEEIVAFVVADERAELTTGVVRRHCRERLEGYMVPTRIEFTDALPQTSSGKISRSQLKSNISTMA